MEVLLNIHGILQPAHEREQEPGLQRDDAAHGEVALASSERSIQACPSATGLVCGPEQGGARHLGILPPGKPLSMVRTLRVPAQLCDKDHDGGVYGFPAVGEASAQLLGSIEDQSRGQSTSPYGSGGGGGGGRVLARVHVLQVQPTEQDIEDRFSVRLTRCHKEENDDDRSDLTSHIMKEAGAGSVSLPTEEMKKTTIRLQIGVYDGHRGPWAADFVAATLPERLDYVCISHQAADFPHRGPGERAPDNAVGAPKAVAVTAKTVFQELDGEILEDFERNHQPLESVSEEKSQLGARLKRLLRLRHGKSRQRGPMSRSNSAADRDKPDTPASTTGDSLSALRAISGCTASMLLLDWEFDYPAMSSVHCPSLRTGTESGQYTAAVVHTGCTINLGDSRTVTADILCTAASASASTTVAVLRRTNDVNSSVSSERERILLWHPLDDPRDLIVGGRLFGETLSTRAFGDGLYKLPLRQPNLPTAARNSQSGGGDNGMLSQQRLTVQGKTLHQFYIRRMSATLVEVQEPRLKRSPLSGEKGVSVGSNGKGTSPVVARPPRTVPLIDRYDAMFSAYSTPPYVSAVPDVQFWHEHIAGTTKDCPDGDRRLRVENESRDKSQDGDEQKPQDAISAVKILHARDATRRIAILATDGLWDLVTSEEAVACVQDELAKQADEYESNLAEGLYRFVVDERGKRAGDDVTVVVVEYDAAGHLNV